jgi:hypothetical protein
MCLKNQHNWKKRMLITYGTECRNIDITSKFKELFIIEDIVNIPRSAIFNDIFNNPVLGIINNITIRTPFKKNIIIYEHRDEDIIIELNKLPPYKQIKINIVAIASRSELYDKMIKSYWIPFITFIKKHFQNVHIYLLFGKDSYIDDLDTIKDNIIVSDTTENYIPGIFYKSIHAFKYLENDDYDYLIRTNMSSFIMIDRLISYLSTLKTDRIYNGIFNYDEGSKFGYIIGWNICMSKDVVSYIVKHENEVDVLYEVNDDICFGSILKDMYSSQSTHDIRCQHRIPCTDDHIDSLIQNNKSSYLFRLKHFHDRNEDIKWLENLTCRFYK